MVIFRCQASHFIFDSTCGKPPRDSSPRAAGATPWAWAYLVSSLSSIDLSSWDWGFTNLPMSAPCAHSHEHCRCLSISGLVRLGNAFPDLFWLSLTNEVIRNRLCAKNQHQLVQYLKWFRKNWNLFTRPCCQHTGYQCHQQRDSEQHSDCPHRCRASIFGIWNPSGGSCVWLLNKTYKIYIQNEQESFWRVRVGTWGWVPANKHCELFMTTHGPVMD